ncbi:MAG TPA: RagB/SusD family nutrient uptake outer membrane protein [Bacteroidales bacterium]|jgi:tetratricopeptide (TPR) repeat protein|nr:RagB/SusD family nutrient uptake outer membrane protein [Bacteroidales bacterium]MDI9533688.1 RagB/SusD family nutrient uptake outer membrane protein [Bacteroidota bacterium]MBP8709817.1 RagB/SusD family nutrient uptake outer membrane protein [Bacteroidales bacterium]MZQ79388.1 RagB/SusD family nutrient uptake outer membrane protein [Bacteroidales bacterium]HHU98618.1 RagB/SusD family nutrient uptake outer membrane protein [Bacteroidales bacterium]
MKTKITISLLIVASLVITTGCEDFLQKDPQGELTQEAFPVTASDALLATNAVYVSIRTWAYHSGGYPILDIMSDDAHKGSNPNDQLPTVGPYETFTHTTTQDGLDRWWSALYEGIKRANVVIEKVPSINMNEQLRNRYIAEASFLRGLFYFDLVRAFGGVPKVTSTTPATKTPRSTDAEIYELIISDLEFAAQHLPEKSLYAPDDAGRATKGAAKSLLARVYLFMGDYKNVEKYALEVIASDEYDLEDDFADANGKNGEHGIESVFEIGAMEVEGAGGNQYANTQGVRGSPNRGWGFNRPSLDLRYSFEEGDPRLDATIIDLGETLDGIFIIGDGTTPDVVVVNGIVTEVECYNQKVWYPGTNTITQWGHNRRLIRYADVLLMAAEALNENDKPGDALPLLNEVRERARGGNGSILPDVTVTEKNALRNAILEERRHELALEGHRFWDLVRTGRAAIVLGPLGFQTGKHELLPIPQNEIDISQGSLQQNPNW